jgi:hypothetical protein
MATQDRHSARVRTPARARQEVVPMKRSLLAVHPAWRGQGRKAPHPPSGGPSTRHTVKKLASPPALVVALACVLAAPASASNNQVSGIQSPPGSPTCSDPTASNAMTESLVGCWYTDTANVTKDTIISNGTETVHVAGTEHFVGCLDVDGDGLCAGDDPQGTLSFTFTFIGQYDATTGNEIRGRCHHPIVSGAGDFAGATVVLNFKDDFVNGTAAYKGHIKF